VTDSNQDAWLSLCGPFPGDDLKEASAAGGFDSILPPQVDPTTGGVYLWTRRISPPTDVMGSSTSFSDWLSGMLSRRQGTVSDSLRHIGQLDLHLGGAKLNDTKLTAIKEMTETWEQRESLRDLLAKFDNRVVLYVGETKCYDTRLEDHLAGRTGFSKRRKEMGHQWTDLSLLIVPMPGASQAQRAALERTLAVLTLAPLTSRAG
jgi:hypothetical protein